MHLLLLEENLSFHLSVWYLQEYQVCMKPLERILILLLLEWPTNWTFHFGNMQYW